MYIIHMYMYIFLKDDKFCCNIMIWYFVSFVAVVMILPWPCDMVCSIFFAFADVQSRNGNPDIVYSI